jgi:RNA polymerase sigma-70 factor (ECF subfamily)
MSKEMFPETTGKPRYLEDKRTCVLPVKLQPGKTYLIALNKPPYDSFMDPDGRKALQYLLVFETKK